MGAGQTGKGAPRLPKPIFQEGLAAKPLADIGGHRPEVSRASGRQAITLCVLCVSVQSRGHSDMQSSPQVAENPGRAPWRPQSLRWMKKIRVTDAGLPPGDGRLIILAEIINITQGRAARSPADAGASPSGRGSRPARHTDKDVANGAGSPAGRRRAGPQLSLELGWLVRHLRQYQLRG